jgi:hypothetical protein
MRILKVSEASRPDLLVEAVSDAPPAQAQQGTDERGSALRDLTSPAGDGDFACFHRKVALPLVS